jgi:UDP-galactopyranose mutase
LALPIARKLGVARTAFHIVDEWQGMAGIPRSMATLTRQMLRFADVTIVPSERLLNRYKPYARRIELLRHGTDLSLFEPVAKGRVAPDQNVLALPGKKIGYYGALHKLDVRLIAEIARARPGWTFVFVGPLAGGQGMGRCESFPVNVHILDALPRAALPALLAGLDVFWMPFAVNELTHSMCPIKLFEAFSAGLPVVSSDLDECRAVAGDFCLFARNAETHLVQLERALGMRGPIEKQRRLDSVRNCDWNNRYQDFLELLQP